MYLEEVKNLEDIKLAKGHVLVEFIEEEQPTTEEKDVVVEHEDGSVSTEKELVETTETVVVKEVIILSNFEGVEKGDIVLEARYPIVDREEATYYYEHKDRKVAILPGFDIKMWTKQENFIK